MGFRKVISYGEANEWLLGDWPEKVEVLQLLPGFWLELWVDWGCHWLTEGNLEEDQVTRVCTVKREDRKDRLWGALTWGEVIGGR